MHSRERPVLEQRSNLVLDDVREAHTSLLVNGLFQADVTRTAMSAVNGQERTHHLKAAIPRFSHAAARCM